MRGDPGVLSDKAMACMKEAEEWSMLVFGKVSQEYLMYWLFEEVARIREQPFLASYYTPLTTIPRGDGEKYQTQFKIEDRTVYIQHIGMPVTWIDNRDGMNKGFIQGFDEKSGKILIQFQKLERNKDGEWSDKVSFYTGKCAPEKLRWGHL